MDYKMKYHDIDISELHRNTRKQEEHIDYLKNKLKLVFLKLDKFQKKYGDRKSSSITLDNKSLFS